MLSNITLQTKWILLREEKQFCGTWSYPTLDIKKANDIKIIPYPI